MEKDMTFQTLPYERPDYDIIQDQMNRLAAEIREAEDYKSVRRLIMENQKLAVSHDEPATLGMIRAYQDCTDTFYAGELPYLQTKEALLDLTPFNDALLNSPFTAEINGEFGEEYLLGLSRSNRLFSQGKDLQAREQELMTEYQQLKAGLKFDFQGNSLSEAEIRIFQQVPDQNVRSECFHSLLQGYGAEKENFERILDELLHVRLSIAEKNGYDSYLDYMNEEKGRRGYGEKELNEFCRQIREEAVPFLGSLYEDQRQRLGVDRLSYIDFKLVFPDGNPRPAGDIHSLYEAARTMYHSLPGDIGDFYDDLLAHGLIDAEFSPNKISGIGFCTILTGFRMPFVFSNSDGTSSDVAVLTHELGHAYQGYLSANNQPLLEYWGQANDIAEIPSKTMELFSYPYAEAFYGNDSRKFLYYHQYEIVGELSWYTMVNEYEGWLYTHKDAATSERSQKYLKYFKDFNPGVDVSVLPEALLADYLLFSSMGVYMFPKYLISYALSEMCALELSQRMQENPTQAWEDYKFLCSSGGSKSYPQLLAQSHLHTAYEEGAVTRALKSLKQNLKNGLI